MLNFKSFLIFSEGIVQLNDEQKQLANDMFQEILKASNPVFLSKNQLVYNPEIKTKWIKKSFDSADLWIVSVPIEEIYDASTNSLRVKSIDRGEFGFDSRHKNKPFIKINLLANLQPDNKIHSFFAEKYFSKKEIWDTLLHEFTHFADKGVKGIFQATGSLDQKGGYLENEAEFNAHLTNVIQACNPSDLQIFIRKPDISSLPPCMANNLQIKRFVAYALSDESRKRNLLKKLASSDYSAILSPN